MANGYRLEKENIFERKQTLLERYVAVANFEQFYIEAWNFLFELHIDLRTAKELNDIQHIALYNSGIAALQTLVAAIISKQSQLLIEEEFNESS